MNRACGNKPSERICSWRCISSASFASDRLESWLLKPLAESTGANMATMQNVPHFSWPLFRWRMFAVCTHTSSARSSSCSGKRDATSILSPIRTLIAPRFSVLLLRALKRFNLAVIALPERGGGGEGEALLVRQSSNHLRSNSYICPSGLSSPAHSRPISGPVGRSAIKAAGSRQPLASGQGFSLLNSSDRLLHIELERKVAHSTIGRAK